MVSDGTVDGSNSSLVDEPSALTAVETAARAFMSAAEKLDGTGQFQKLAAECEAIDRVVTAAVKYILMRKTKNPHLSDEGRELHEAVDNLLAVEGIQL